MQRWLAMLALTIIVLAVPSAGLADSTATTVASFDAAAADTPDGLALGNDGNLYVGFSSSGQIKRVTPNGVTSDFATLPARNINAVASDPTGRYLYAALASGDVNTHGIWRVSVPGGERERFAALELSTVPNGLAFRGEDLFVADSAGGRILKVAASRAVTVWKTDGLLQSGFPRGVGASGLAFGWAQPSTGLGVSQGVPSDREYLYVANAAQGRIVRIPVQNGDAGTAEVIYQNVAQIGGADGLAFSRGTSGGTLYITVRTHNRIVALPPGPSPQGQVIAENGPLQSPAGLVRTANTLYIANSAWLNTILPELGAPRPALLRIAVSA